MKRPMLVSGITIALLCVLLTLYPQSAVIVLALGVLVLFLCLFKKSGLRKVILLPTCCVCAVITALSFFAYRKTCVEPCITHHNKTTSVQGKVITAPTSDDKFTYFTVKSTKIDGNNEGLKIYVTAPLEAEKTISLYDNVHLSKACISIPLTDKNQYDLTQGADGVLLTATTSSAEVISKAEKRPTFTA